ncbi:MAG: ctpA [Gammaproteobacteria bacterium]|jgi:carboxyl-terminal processing protease|nr:ctpA [Gammaproteobacteria bacterium]
MQVSYLRVKILLLGLFIGLIPLTVWATQPAKTAIPDDVPVADIDRFTAAIQDIKQYYVEPVDDKVLFENAIRGMLAGLDPHSTYLDINDYAELQSATQGEFGGVGIEVDTDNEWVRVVTPIDDTPAAKAGLKPGDLIVKINNQPLDGLSLTDAVKLMRGPKGSVVELTILRKGAKAPLQFKIVRDVIRTQSVKSKLLAPGYAYVRISQFQAPTAADLATAIKNLQQENKKPLKGFILDLRNNPGGLLDSAIAVSNDFLNSAKLGKNKLIVYTKGRSANSALKANADGVDLINGIPMIVLINGGSASAAEIVAGALQDHNRAIIMGETSFGKGSVQTVLPLDDQHGIKITTALYYTPHGRSIQAKGITPDIEVNELDISDSKTNSVLDVKEADLAKHLSNSDNDKNATAPEKPLPSTIPDPTQDYQLNQALVLLKGLNTLHGAAYRQ